MVKTGRNDSCPCGSGLKYKKCCLSKAAAKQGKDSGNMFEALKAKYKKRHNIKIKNDTQIEGIRKSGRLVTEALDQAEKLIKPGLKTEEINTLVHDLAIKNNAIPATLNYRGFPKSVCVSVNEVICHGIPGKRALAEGDIVNVDITYILNGYFADASRTFLVGDCGKDAKKIVAVSRECLRRGILAAQPGAFTGDIGHAIQSYAEANGCSVVREYVGHGVGTAFHEAPQIPHYGKKRDGVRLVPGMTFTIEPMINLGDKKLHILDDDWTAVTSDGSLSAQFEQTIVITPDGNESLTPFDLE